MVLRSRSVCVWCASYLEVSLIKAFMNAVINETAAEIPYKIDWLVVYSISQSEQAFSPF